MSSTPGAAIGSTSRPRTLEPGGAAGLESVERGRIDRVVAMETDATAADIGLVREPVGIELQRDGTGRSARAAATAEAASAAAMAGSRAARRERGGEALALGQRRRGQRAEALALGQRRGAAASVRGRSGAASAVRRPVGGERRPAGRHGPARPRLAAALPSRATVGDRPERLERPAQHRGPAERRRGRAFVSGGGSPEVSDT